MAKNKVSGLVTTIAVVALLLGCLGAFTVVTQAFTLLFPETVFNFSSSMASAGIPSGLKDQMDLIYEDQIKLQKEWLLVNGTVLLVHAVVCCLLIWGAIQIFRAKPGGRKILIYGLLLGIFQELIGIYPAYVMLQANAELQKGLYRAMDNPSTKMPVKLESMAEISFIIGMVILGGLLFFKILFYALSSYHLSKPKVKLMLDGDVPMNLDSSQAFGEQSETDSDDDLLR